MTLRTVFHIAYVFTAFCLSPNIPRIYLEKLSWSEANNLTNEEKNIFKKCILITHHTRATRLSPPTWESVWIGRPSLKALRTENVHGVVQSRPFLK